MGGMKFNHESFGETSKSAGKMIIEDPTDIIPVPEAGMPSFSAASARSGNMSLQLKSDIVSNIVSDVCSLAGTITNAVRDVSVEKEKTRQIRAMGEAHVGMAKEETKKIKIQEREATKRLSIECEQKIQTLKIELQKDELSFKNMAHERQVNEEIIHQKLDIFSEHIHSVIDIFRKVLDENPQNNELFVTFTQAVNNMMDKLAQL